MKYWKCILLLLALLATCTACGGDKQEQTLGQLGSGPQEEVGFHPSYYRRVARLVQEDGWVYTFIENVPVDGDFSDIIRYQFQGMNIRFRYGENSRQSVSNVGENGSAAPQTALQPIQQWGSATEAQRADRAILDSFLRSPCLPPEELLALDPERYTLQTLDKDIFFFLMRQALTGEPAPWGKDPIYRDLPVQVFLWEPNYLSGYRFQVAFLHSTGCVDELYIDVLYPTGNDPTDYAQLSVLVEEGNATPEQQALFLELQRIVQAAKESESYLAGAESYREKTFGPVRLSRLYQIMKDIHENNLEGYDLGY